MGDRAGFSSYQIMNESPLKALIVEDQASARDHLRFLLSQRHDIQVLGEAASVTGSRTTAIILVLSLAMLGECRKNAKNRYE